MNLLSTPDYYDALANGGLADYHFRRRASRETIDTIVMHYAPARPRYLDAGCGDGERAARLAFTVRAPEVVLCDVSPQMAARAAQRATTLTMEIEALGDQPDLLEGFDLVTCLGNTIGHARDPAKLVASLARTLAPDGVLVLDLHSLYNAGAYGWTEAMRNWALHQTGLITGHVPLVQGEVATAVKLFSRREFERTYRGTGLRFLNRYFVDYDTGAFRRSQWGGQMAYVFRKPTLRATVPYLSPRCLSFGIA